MNNKGFTLIELLATIGLLVLMSTIIGVNITSILKSTEDNEKKSEREIIEKAACVFVDSSENKTTCKKETKESIGCNITVENLIESGLVGDNFFDKKNNTIAIKWVDGEKKCEYKG